MWTQFSWTRQTTNIGTPPIKTITLIRGRQELTGYSKKKFFRDVSMDWSIGWRSLLMTLYEVCTIRTQTPAISVSTLEFLFLLKAHLALINEVISGRKHSSLMYECIGFYVAFNFFSYFMMVYGCHREPIDHYIASCHRHNATFHWLHYPDTSRLVHCPVSMSYIYDPTQFS